MRLLLVTCGLICGLAAMLAGAQPSPDPRPSSLDGDDDVPDAGHNERTASDSLPPDTFRKLAQALYQRGDKTANRMQRKFFYNETVTCNDGSVAGFYLRRNYNSKRWIIFLEGGWICHDRESCSSRSSREHYRMSSDRWPSVKAIGGILSADPEENPFFADANHVFVPYCSSDAWSGTRFSRDVDDDPSFLGHYIVREVVKELVDFEQLLFHEELYLAGGSAGGAGVLVNVDTVAGMLSPAGIRVRGIVDSGWFLDNVPFTEDCGDGNQCSVMNNFQKGVRMWDARVPHGCARDNWGQEWKCFLGYKLYPYIKTPLFIIQWQFDTFQMYADNVALPTSRDQWNYIHQGARNLRETFEGVNAVFSPSCIAHEVITTAHWTQVKVQEVSLPEALHCWAESLPKTIDVEFDQGGDRRFMFEKELTTGLHGRSASMLSDSPHSYKLASNLVRSIPTGSSGQGAESSKNSITSHLEKRRKHKKGGRRNGGGGGGRRKRGRRRNGLRCNSNSTSCSGDFSEGGSSSGSGSPDGQVRNNVDLVRKLGRRKRVTNKQKKHNQSAEERRRRRERRKRRKQERRRRRRERKQRQKRQRRLERRRLRLQQQELESAAAAKKHHLKVRSAEPASPDSSSTTCQLKLIDRCSFPHCNKSCPKIKSPETGKEIDFLTLLQSFGLSTRTMAKALGVDVATLNSMDRDVLFQMLTQTQRAGN